MGRRSKKARQQRRRRISLYLALTALAILLLRAWPAGKEEGLYLESNYETLARVIRSEVGIGTAKQKLHVAWATRNLASERGQSIAAMACSPCGPQERGRPLSTRQNALDSDRALALRVLEAPLARDPTMGATHFINPALQDQLARNGKLPGYKGNTYRRVRRRWKNSYGWEPYYRLGPTLEMWGKKRSRKRSRRNSGLTPPRGPRS